jgi:hypothetical protein
MSSPQSWRVPQVASRRESSADNAAAPVVASGGADEPCPDPLVADVRAWIAEWNESNALMREYKDLETALIGRHGGMTAAQAIARGIPEGFVMRSLERRCDAIDRKLERDAERIVQTRAKTAEGAIAKIELGLEMQSPFDRDDFVWALIEGACKDLRELMSGGSRDVGIRGSGV